MNTATTLLKREFWEHKGGFFWTPIALGGFLLLMTVIALTTGRLHGTIRVDEHALNFGDLIQHLANQPFADKAEHVQTVLMGLSMPFHIAVFFVICFYAVGCLYDERKDRSILFWRSLPVSDSKTVLAKFATALLVAPALALAASFATQFLWLLLMSMAAFGHDIPVWENVWATSAPWSLWPSLTLATAIDMLWLAPLIGWLFLVSAYAKKAPLLMAVLIPLLLAWAESMFLHSHVLFGLLRERFEGPLADIFEHRGEGSVLSASTNRALELFASNSLWAGLVFAALCLAGAIWLRRRSGEV
ncbi:MAG: hypothetical protein HYV16_11910 [Gammaproteobacteria bacterium]|nr:hypothetical protein [Gammaproteobacteria bacterium]